jgi:hypothetical protein
MNIIYLHQDSQLALYLCTVYVFSIANFIIKIPQYVNQLLTSTLTNMEESHFKRNQYKLNNPVTLGNIMSYIDT